MGISFSFILLCVWHVPLKHLLLTFYFLLFNFLSYFCFWYSSSIFFLIIVSWLTKHLLLVYSLFCLHLVYEHLIVILTFSFFLFGTPSWHLANMTFYFCTFSFLELSPFLFFLFSRLQLYYKKILDLISIRRSCASGPSCLSLFHSKIWFSLSLHSCQLFFFSPDLDAASKKLMVVTSFKGPLNLKIVIQNCVNPFSVTFIWGKGFQSKGWQLSLLDNPS